MSRPTRTSKPTLNAPPSQHEDAAARELLRRIDEEYGVGDVIQTKQGGLVAQRLDTETGRVEYYRGGTWGHWNAGVWTEA